MSYQHSEEDALLAPIKRIENETNRRNWKYVVLAASLGVFGVLGVSVYQFAPTSSRVSGKTILQLSKTNIMYASLSDDEKSVLFDEFKSLYGREYSSTEEEEEKFSNFKTFLELVDTRNTAESGASGTATHGITKFADLSEEEFRIGYLGYKANTKDSRKLTAKKGVIAPRKTAVTVKNWAGLTTTAVKDQGYCGSCWAFSVTEQIESAAITSGLLTTSQKLSPQQIVSCDVTDYGCDGGNTETAYAYVEKAGGIMLDTDYPYTSYYDETGTCDVDSEDFKVTVDSYYTVSGETEMETYVLETGPLSVCLAASTWSTYTSGIISSCDHNVDHCVQVVGVDMDSDYWIVRNSWGTEWGEEGYIYLETGSNLCDITYDPTYVSVAIASKVKAVKPKA